jgi:hypothetical protein
LGVVCKVCGTTQAADRTVGTTVTCSTSYKLLTGLLVLLSLVRPYTICWQDSWYYCHLFDIAQAADRILGTTVTCQTLRNLLTGLLVLLSLVRHYTSCWQDCWYYCHLSDTTQAADRTVGTTVTCSTYQCNLLSYASLMFLWISFIYQRWPARPSSAAALLEATQQPCLKKTQ